MVDSLVLDLPFAAPPSLERVFLDWNHAALPAVVALLAERYAIAGELRMTDATVVLPGMRAGRRLQELLAADAERRKLRLIPPQVISIGQLPELLYRTGLPFATDALARSAWAGALRGLPADRLTRLFAARPPESDLRGWGRLGRIVANLHRTLGGAGMGFAGVGECCADGLLFADTERWSVLAEVEAAYAATLLRLGFADRNLARIDAVAAGTIDLDRDLWITGVVEMPAVLRRMLESLPDAGDRVKFLVHAPAAEAAAFDEFGCVRAEAWADRTLPLRDEQISICARPADQAEEVVRVLAGFGERYAAEDIVVATPDPELVPYLEQRLGAAGVAVHASEGAPLEHSRVARLLVAFADYLDGARFDALAALARHPDLWLWLRRTRAFASADAWLEPLDEFFTEHLPARIQGSLSAPRAHGAAEVDALRAALADDRMLGRMRGRKPLSEWMPGILELVTQVYAEPMLDTSVAADRRLVDACHALREAADALYRLPPELGEVTDATTAIRLLIDELQGKMLAPDPERDAVELLGWLELRLDDAPVALLTGFNEPYLPESVNGHAFLPNALCERLGIVDNAHRYARDAYQLTALLHSRAEVRVIAGRRGGTGDPLRPSRLLFAVEGRSLAERVRRFYADTAPGVAPSAPNEAAPVGRFRMPTQPVIHAPEPIDRLPVTAFRQLLADPYLYALEKIVRLDTHDDAARELDGMRFGSLAHTVLERFSRSEDVDARDESRVRRRLDALLDALALTQFGTQALPAVRVQLEQLRARLHAFARWQARWVAAGWHVVGVECCAPRSGVEFVVDGEPFHLTGRIDRIDYHPESGRLALFDYKTGDQGKLPDDTHRAGRKENRHWTDLQLPLYRHLLPALRDGDGRPLFADLASGAVQLGYILLPRDLDAVSAEFAPWTEEELATADECAREVIRQLRRNEFVFDPRRLSAYRKSDFAAILGVGYLESAAAAESELGSEG